MKKHEIMTKYIPLIKNDDFGEWKIDTENDGTPEHPKQMPFVMYSRVVHDFIEDVYKFHQNNEDYMLNRYGEILENNKIEWGQKSMSEVDVSSMNGQVVMALIMGAVRAERFCDGALLGLLKDGSILKWLERLQDIDDI